MQLSRQLRKPAYTSVHGQEHSQWHRSAPPLTTLVTPAPRGRWVAALRALPQCKNRLVRATAVDPDGLGTLLPRYLAPTRLPPAFAEAARAVRRP